MASLDSLTDSEIRKKLNNLGYPVGPITDTTRKVFIKKLKQLLEQSKSEEQPKTRRSFSSSRFSSGESSEDDSKPSTRRRNMPPPKTTPVKSTRRKSPGRSAGNYKEESEVEYPVAIGSFTASVESTQASPVESSSFLNSTAGSKSPLFGSYTSRRSLIPEVDSKWFSSYNYGNGVLADDEHDLEGSNRSTVYSGSSRFSKPTDGLTHPLSSVSFTNSFKSRFLNNKTNNDDGLTGKKNHLSDYDNSFPSDFRSRFSGGRTSIHSSRLGNLGVSNVKESDDEEPVQSTLSHSVFNNRLRRDKSSALDSPWWKNSSLVSMGLVFTFIVFFIIIFISYLNVKWQDGTISVPGLTFNR